MKEYHVLGLMSGTSLDGLDIACCTFKLQKSKWAYSIACAETIKYGKTWRNKLELAHLLSAEKLLEAHNEYGKFLGTAVLNFIKKYKLTGIDLISSHGHTVFHNPSPTPNRGRIGYTFQLGNGAAIASTNEITVVSDFRTLDVALKGQGAPLVPIGDSLLFPEYSFCLNLGGFSNISFELKGKRIAFDICPVNTALNYLALSKGKSFDKGGSMAKSGKVNLDLLKQLNGLAYYKKKYPKSLGREWLSARFLPLLDGFSISIEDKLATVTEHIALQLSREIISSGKKGNVLITGGGTNNGFLISKFREKLPGYEIVIPSPSLVNFKEALVFAFLGVLRVEQKINTLHSVTGAVRDSSGGTVFIL
jgi:anhydro-N-acetylmuramic acid kinase